MFATIVVHCEPSDPKQLLNNFMSKLIADLRRRYIRNREAQKMLHDDTQAREYVLLEVSQELLKFGRGMEKYGLPSVDTALQDLPDLEEKKEVDLEALRMETKSQIICLNEEQMQAFTAVVSAALPGVTAGEPFKPVNSSECLKERNKVFFLDASGGTGKTFLIQAIHKLLRCRERKVIAVATSAVAASLLYRGRTAHSVFKIPIPCDSTSTCNISVESKLAQEMREVDLIIWDEVVMCNRYCIEAVDRALRDIMRSEAPFGGKCVLFSGDYRQILPVIQGGSRAQVVNACFKSSALFSSIQILKPHENMRLNELRKDPLADKDALLFPEYLLRVGEGQALSDEGRIGLPKSINLIEAQGSDEKARLLVDNVFEGIETKYDDTDWLSSNAILTVKNSQLFRLNELIGNKIPGAYRRYLSADSVNCENELEQTEQELRYPQELLNRLSGGAAMPDHNLLLKNGFIVMLLRNICSEEGHANGTRYVVTE